MRATVFLFAALLVACPPADDDDATDEVEVLDPEPAGAPAGVVDGRLTCLGDNAPPAPVGNAVELTGYVRALVDPTADEEPPVFEVEAFSPGGSSLGTSFSNPGNDGRAAVTVPIDEGGFDGYVVVSSDGYVDLRFQSSRATTTTDFSGWAWAATTEELDEAAEAIGLVLDPDLGVLIGAAHDCDAFGMENVVITVEGDADVAYYVEGFDVAADRSYSAISGRFAVPDVEPGDVVIKAFGRLESGGPLTLLSSIHTAVEVGGMTAVALEPRVALQ